MDTAKTNSKYLNEKSVYDGEEASSKSDRGTVEWKTIASAKYSILDFDDFNSNDVNEEYDNFSIGEDDFHDVAVKEVKDDYIVVSSDEEAENGPSNKKRQQDECIIVSDDEEVTNVKRVEYASRQDQPSVQVLTAAESDSSETSEPNDEFDAPFIPGKPCGPRSKQRKNTRYRNKKRKYEKKATETEHEGESRRSFRSKRTDLPLYKKVEILEELEKGKAVSRLTKKYGVSHSAIYCIQKKKDKILNYVQSSEGHNEEWAGLVRSKRIELSLCKKVDILEELEAGVMVAQLAEKYGISQSAIYTFQQRKDEILEHKKHRSMQNCKECHSKKILNRETSGKPPTEKWEISTKFGKRKSVSQHEENNPQNLKEEEEEDNLQRIQPKRSKQKGKQGHEINIISTSKTLEITEELEKEESIFENYVDSPRTMPFIQEINTVPGSEKKGEVHNFSLVNMPLFKQDDRSTRKKQVPSLSRMLKIMEDFNKGVSTSRIASTYHISLRTILKIQKNKDKIMRYIQKSIKTGKEHNLNMSNLSSSTKCKRPRLPVSKKIDVLTEHAEDEDSTSNNIQKRKDKGLSCVHVSIENGEVGNLKRKKSQPKRIKRSTLPLSKQLDILAELDNGETLLKLSEKYGVSQKMVYNIRQRKDKLIRYINRSIENGDEVNLKRKQLPPSKGFKRTTLPLSKQLDILAELDNGETIPKLSEKYGVSQKMVYNIRQRKDKIIRYTNKSIENGEEVNLKRKQLPPSKRIKRTTLPLSKQLDILAELDNGETVPRLSEKYGVSQIMIYKIRQRKNKIIRYRNKSIENGKEDNLKRSRLPPSWATKRIDLPLYKKVEILEELEQGTAMSQLSTKYGVSQSAIYCIQKKKDKILNYVKSSASHKEDTSQWVKMLRFKRTELSLCKKAEVLEKFETGDQVAQLAEMYNISQSSIYALQKRREDILKHKSQCSMQNCTVYYSKGTHNRKTSAKSQTKKLGISK